MNQEATDIEFEHTIYGNGQKGLKSELIELKTEINTFKRIAIYLIGILVAILVAVLKGLF